MFNRIKHLKPEKVSFKLEDGKPCFYTYRAFTHKTQNSSKEEYTQKQLNQISRELFDIQRFNEKHPKFKGLWTLTEETAGKGHCWVLKFFPFTGEKPEEYCENLETILQLMYK